MFEAETVPVTKLGGFKLAFSIDFLKNQLRDHTGALIKLNEETGLPDNVTKKGEPNFTNIAKYAVNGAVHYANAIVRHTTYKEVLAIGVNGYITKLE